MPSRLFDENDRVLARRDLARDFGEVQGHRRAVAWGQDEHYTLAVMLAEGSENVGGALI